jgi:hypothetical protein
MNQFEFMMMVDEAGLANIGNKFTFNLQKFATLVSEHEKAKVKEWMTEKKFKPEQGSIDGLLDQIDWMVSEQECDFCAKICEEADPSATPSELAAAIRARG